jgi:hypothetical protein
MANLISERVQVTPGENVVCAAFRWRGRTYRVVDVLSDHRQVDTNAHWQLRRHRRRVVVRTEDERFFELYAERPGQWVLYRELDDPFG